MTMKTKRRRDESPQRAPNRSCKNKRRRHSNSFKELDFEHLNVQEVIALGSQVLNLPNGYNISKQHLKSMRDLMPKLRSLNLECSHTLTNQDFASLVGFDAVDSEAKVLESLDDATTFMLESLNLTRTIIGDAGIAAITMRCKNLKYLYLGHTQISDISLSLIAENCPGLNTLDVSGCAIGDYGLQLIAQECKTNLVNLVINDCSRVTDAVIPRLCFYCTELKRLEIRNTKISSRCLSFVLQKLHLTDLNFEGLPISDVHLERTALLQKGIRTLNLSYCYDLSAEGIRRLLDSCKTLEEVHLYGLSLEENYVSSLRRDGLIVYWC